MLDIFIFVALLLSVVVFTIYERILHTRYKKDLIKEKSIAEFSLIRMQLMRMVYMKEIAVDSCYFNFMMKATSYSIRTLYFYKDINQGLAKVDIMAELLKTLVEPCMKDEFNNLNSEQRSLFMNVTLNILKLHVENNYIERIIFQLYVLQFKLTIMKCLTVLIKRFSDKKTQEKLTYIDDVNNSYNLGCYAFSC